ncbi:MAG: hypothetical protein IPM27_00600 [Nitrosomonadales bacterium]|nr:hypothetical protein [Nitrosomonadales bacterium]
MKSTGSCEYCKKAVAEKALPETAKPIGDDVIIRTAIGRGHDQTAHNFSQCSECGSVWVSLVDSGAGGHGRFHRCLTTGLF